MEASPETVSAFGPDTVILATGSRPWRPPVPGIDDSRVVTSLDVLNGAVAIGQRVLVVAGLDDHLPAPTIAAFLAAQGKQVEVIAEPMVVGAGIEPSSLHLLTRHLLELGVTLSPLTALASVAPDAVTVVNTFTGRERRIDGVDTVVLACGSRARDDLSQALAGRVPDIHRVGDCVAPRRLVHAMLSGARVGSLV